MRNVKCESCGYVESHDPNCPRPEKDIDTVLGMVRGMRDQIDRSPGLSSAPFSDDGWATIERALASARRSTAPLPGDPSMKLYSDDQIADLLGIEVTRIESRNEAKPDGYRISGMLGREIVRLMHEAERRLSARAAGLECAPAKEKK